ncbi:RNA-binding protein 24-B-like [Zingiber officinale]|uniref:RNA-binding protein 24-B-like n=1 Tax=Zingiber officinale TaxID=94328 RepID=UPI001C4A7AF2|nr:RNA-binding protein 24-B-like [Zingiber officinale]
MSLSSMLLSPLSPAQLSFATSVAVVALPTLHGKCVLIEGRLATCNLAWDGLNSTSGTGDLALRKIYIGGLSPNISSEILLNFFGRYGEIEEGSVAYHKETNKSRGFGFVTYRTAEGAKKAIDDPNKTRGRLYKTLSFHFCSQQVFLVAPSTKSLHIQGRNITAKLADAPRSKVIQAQVPTAVVPMHIPVPIGYAPMGKAQVGSYASYPPTMAAYLTAYASTQFTTAAQVSHPQTGKRKQVVVPAVESNGVTG